MAVSITQEELQRLTGQIRDAQTENFELREQVTSLIASNAKLNDELERQTKSLVESQVAAANVSNGAGGDKKKSRFDRLVDKVKESRDFQAEIDNLQAQLASRESEDVRLRAMEQNTQHLQRFARDAQVQLAEKDTQLEALRRTVAEQRGVIESQPELQEKSRDAEAGRQLDAAREELAARDASVRDLQGKLDATTAQLRALEESTAGALQEASSRQIGYERTLGAKNDEIAGLQRLKGVVENLEKSVKAKDEEIRRKDADCSAWKEQCDHMGQMLLQSKDEAFAAKEKGDALEEFKKLQARSEEALQLERQLRKDSETNLCEMRSQNEQLVARLEQAMQANGEVESLQKAVASQQSHIASLKEAIRLREAACDRNQVGYDHMKRELVAANKEAQRAQTLDGEIASLRTALAHTVSTHIVDSLVDTAAYSVEAARAARYPAAEAQLKKAQAEADHLRGKAKHFDQRLEDLKSEHKIDIRKKDMLIKELQSQLRSEARHDMRNADAASSCAPSPSPFKSPSVDGREVHIDPAAPPPLGLPAVGGGSGMLGAVVPQQAAHGSGADVAALQQEQDVLIRKVAQLKEENWSLEEQQRAQDRLVKHLREDNEKKNVILENWLTGPAVEQLLKNKKKLLVPKKEQTWLGMMGTAVASQKQSSINEKLQELLQDTLSQNIILQKKVDAYEQQVRQPSSSSG